MCLFGFQSQRSAQAARAHTLPAQLPKEHSQTTAPRTAKSKTPGVQQHPVVPGSPFHIKLDKSLW